MKLVLGSHVREHGRNVGRLAGFELEPADLRIRRIIFSPDGHLGPQAQTRPLSSIASVAGNGAIELRASLDDTPLPAVRDVALLSGSTRIAAAGGRPGRVCAVELNPEDRSVTAIVGRQHWWSRRSALARDQIDASSPGEIRRRGNAGTRAA
jgi:hypothetical protein